MSKLRIINPHIGAIISLILTGSLIACSPKLPDQVSAQKYTSPSDASVKDAQLSKTKSAKVKSVEMTMGGKTFSVPTEHLASLMPAAQLTPFETAGTNTFLAHFSAAWLSAHVDGYQPILNKGFQGDAIFLAIGEKIKKDYSRLHPVAMNLWYKREPYENRVIMAEKEFNTGFYVIQPIPYQSRADYEGEQWFLTETLPDKTKPYPTEPRWQPIICSRKTGLIEGARVNTKCIVRGKIAEDIFLDIDLSSENLYVRDLVISALAKEIKSWIVEKDANDGN